MKIEVTVSDGADAHTEYYGQGSNVYSVMVDGSIVRTFRSIYNPLSGEGSGTIDQVVSFLAGLITGHCGAKIKSDHFPLAREMVNRARKNGSEVRYVTAHLEGEGAFCPIDQNRMSSVEFRRLHEGDPVPADDEFASEAGFEQIERRALDMLEDSTTTAIAARIEANARREGRQ